MMFPARRSRWTNLVGDLHRLHNCCSFAVSDSSHSSSIYLNCSCCFGLSNVMLLAALIHSFTLPQGWPTSFTSLIYSSWNSRIFEAMLASTTSIWKCEGSSVTPWRNCSKRPFVKVPHTCAPKPCDANCVIALSSESREIIASVPLP